MTTLVTGAAGFIGYHLSEALLKNNHEVIGIDNLNSYYDVHLKHARLAQLKTYPHFHFYPLDITQLEPLMALNKTHPDINQVVHLAAQAGVRYSLSQPFAYSDANLLGHLTMLEFCRTLSKLEHLVYASSSSVYGNNTKLPFSVKDTTDHPISLYAATKRSGELMSYSYSHLYGLPTTGLRFFTVYGPFGRPDMSAYLFTKAIFEGSEIPVFNKGDMRRNFSYIDDIVEGTLACLNKPPRGEQPLHRLYNLGNNRTESLMDFIKVLEHNIGKQANIVLSPMQPGDVKETLADITETTRDFGFLPKTNIEVGLAHFVKWFKAYHGL